MSDAAAPVEGGRLQPTAVAQKATKTSSIDRGGEEINAHDQQTIQPSNTAPGELFDDDEKIGRWIWRTFL
jgi:hypothetical protein